MRKIYLSLVLFFALLLAGGFYGCGAEPASKTKESAAKDGEVKDLEEAVNQLEKLFSKEGKDIVEPVNFRELKKFFPQKTAGMKLDKTTGNTSSAVGKGISTANATYVAGDKEVKMTIVDAGGMGKIIASMIGMADIKHDEETEDGYSRIFSYKGYKAFEKYDKKTNDGEFGVIIAGRFLLTVSGNEIDMDVLKEVIDDVDIKGLAKLAE